METPTDKGARRTLTPVAGSRGEQEERKKENGNRKNQIPWRRGKDGWEERKEGRDGKE